jgi:hypothetical protein
MFFIKRERRKEEIGRRKELARDSNAASLPLAPRPSPLAPNP